MFQNKKIYLIILAAASLLFLLYSIFYSKNVSNNYPDDKKQTVDLAQIEKNYKADLKSILDDYSSMLKKDEIKPEEAKSVRDRLLALKLPSSKYKEMHLELVLSAAKIEKDIQANDRENAREALKIISKLKVNNIWLN